MLDAMGLRFAIIIEIQSDFSESRDDKALRDVLYCVWSWPRDSPSFQVWLCAPHAKFA